MRNPSRETKIDAPPWLHPAARVVYRDDDLLVAEKPPGVLSHPNLPERRSPRALVDGVFDSRREAFDLSGGRGPVFLVHRLDQETSGLILLSFDEECASLLKEALAARRVSKEYRAVLLGTPRPAHGTWKDRLEKSRGGGHAKVAVRRGEANATLAYESEITLRPAGVTVVSLRPETGRTHQLRVQTAARGVPILGDPLYGDFTANRYLARELGIKRMLLHAVRLRFAHPRRGTPVDVASPVTGDWDVALAALGALRSPLPRRTAPRPARGRRGP